MKMSWLMSPLMALSMLSVGAAAEPVDLSKDAPAAKQALAKAKITLSEAVEIALKKIPGKAVAGELVADGDKLNFTVEIIADGKHKDVQIDALSGVVDRVDDVTAEDLKAEAEEVKAEEAVAQAATTLSQAIATAMKTLTEGKCLEAGPKIKKKTSKLIFEVDLLLEDKVKEVQIDATSGAVLRIKDE